ncbi:MAG: methylenetetrahydrofolate reductase C-terminal domain-containing protein [Planctomycetaceae bacterium]
MIYEIEKWIKEKIFDCQTCGQCVLSHTAYICPMNCPKGLRNGPCGGTLDGKCEVIPDKECVWMRIDQKKNVVPDTVHVPPDKSLYNTASYVNLINGKDRGTRLPQPVIDTHHIAASSKLSQKMYKKEFVVTLEIASPLTEKDLARVDRIMACVADQVDSVNTTTNAGGVPSLHSTETAKVVMAHGVEPVIQFCGRDQHEPELLEEMEKSMAMGYRNFLLLTGDWLPGVDCVVNQQSWFPMDSLQMIHAVNQRLEDYQQRLGIVPFIGCASNPFSTPMEITVQRLHNKRYAGARFSQTQAITNADIYARWYAELRKDRQEEARLVIPSIPLVGSRRAFEVLCRLPGVFVDPSLHAVMENKDFRRRSLEWALGIADGVTEHGAAGVHVMNFGMPPDLINEFLTQIRDRAREARRRSEYAWS